MFGRPGCARIRAGTPLLLVAACWGLALRAALRPVPPGILPGVPARPTGAKNNQASQKPNQ